MFYFRSISIIAIVGAKKDVYLRTEPVKIFQQQPIFSVTKTIHKLHAGYIFANNAKSVCKKKKG